MSSTDQKASTPNNTREDVIDDLSRFLDELNKESDRGLALVGAALIDEKLSKTLRSYFCEENAADKLLSGSNAPLGTFSSHIEACFALGLIDEFEYSEINLIRKVRNEFAHSIHGTTFKNQRITGLCSSLKSDLPDKESFLSTDPRFRYKNAIACTILRIYYRPEWVKKEQCKPRNWGEQFETKWHSVEDELPPENVPVMVMAKRTKKRSL